jgi:hypothetical protein
MSQISISNALETRLAAIASPLPTQWENKPFSPVDGEAYQQADILFGKPENPTANGNFNRQKGFMQIRLNYPLGTGRLAAQTRAESLAVWFKRGLSFSSGGVTTIIDKTPEISKGGVDGSRYVLIVRIPFFSNVEG